MFTLECMPKYCVTNPLEPSREAPAAVGEGSEVPRVRLQLAVLSSSHQGNGETNGHPKQGGGHCLWQQPPHCTVPSSLVWLFCT